MLGRSGRVRSRIAALLVCASASAFGQTVGVLTVAEGRVVLVRGATTYAAAAGVAIQNGDILAADPKGQAQIEFDDGAILNLARGSRALLLAAQGAGGEPGVALQAGWVKFTRAKAAKDKPYRYTAPLARLSTAGATGVIRVGADACELFIESGAARLVELSKGGLPGAGRDVKGGEFVARREGQPLAVAPRPSSEFVKAMPGYFRDDLPAFLPRVRGKAAELKREHEATYDEVGVWLRASQPVRRGLMERFQGRAKDAQFRSRVIENLAAHPEWDPVVHPEKYEKDKEKENGDKAAKAAGR
jgi:hypothetical protein